MRLVRFHVNSPPIAKYTARNSMYPISATPQSSAAATARWSVVATGESQETTASTVVVRVRGVAGCGGMKSSRNWPSGALRRRLAVLGLAEFFGGALWAVVFRGAGISGAYSAN